MFLLIIIITERYAVEELIWDCYKRIIQKINPINIYWHVEHCDGGQAEYKTT